MNLFLMLRGWLVREHRRNCDCRKCWDRNLEKAFRMWEQEERRKNPGRP